MFESSLYTCVILTFKLFCPVMNLDFSVYLKHFNEKILNFAPFKIRPLTIGAKGAGKKRWVDISL